MGAFLEMTEKSAWLLALEAKSDEELHELRLFIKRWRYILAEFFGLTTLELVKAQQLLGKHHDLTRLLHQLNLEVERLGTQKCHGADQARSRISLELAKVLDDIKPVIANLPYGLRPHTVSIEPEQ
jgi:CHAD domain-containing protein